MLEGDDTVTGHDELHISEDRRTLSFKLEGVGFAEFIRVLVREPEREKETSP